VIELEFTFIGWCNEANHDKVYSTFTAEGVYYSAWGRRGAKLQFKKLSGQYESDVLTSKKRKKYKECDKFLLFTFFPNFDEKVNEELFMATLSGKINK
jgi:hypothetical protein